MPNSQTIITVVNPSSLRKPRMTPSMMNTKTSEAHRPSSGPIALLFLRPRALHGVDDDHQRDQHHDVRVDVEHRELRRLRNLYHLRQSDVALDHERQNHVAGHRPADPAEEAFQEIHP